MNVEKELYNKVRRFRAENAKLRAINQRLAGFMDHTDEIEQLRLERNQLDAQVRNLRAALERISVHYPDPSPAGMIARTALEDKKTK